MRTAVWDGVIIFLAGPNMTIPSYDEYPTPVGHGVEVIYYPCAQSLSVSVETNKVHQNSTIVPTQILEAQSEPMYKYICLDKETGEPSTTLQYQECMYTGNPALSTDTYVVLADPADPSQNYTVSYDTLFAVKGRIGDYFISSWAWNGFDAVFQANRNCLILIADMAMWTGNASSIIETIEAKVERFATSATSLFRVWPTVVSDSHSINGTVWAMQTYVHVRWGWISFLASQLVVGAVFLISTIVVSFRHHAAEVMAAKEAGAGHQSPVLKSSAFAVLFALSDESRRLTGSVQTVSGMNSRAGGLMGRMEGGEMIITRDGGV
ncbi:hypothetical protein GQ53DRAFT_839680 [Thozetella sp. PMI_491]|nr:hypothetical protein GQ53DRAFT_839680 [Thozetella sp. PMI_491]